MTQEIMTDNTFFLEDLKTRASIGKEPLRTNGLPTKLELIALAEKFNVAPEDASHVIPT